MKRTFAERPSRTAERALRGLFALPLAGLLLAALAPAASAHKSSATVSVQVFINAPASVEIDAAPASTHPVTLTPGGAPVVSPATATVRNDAVGLTEKWRLSSGPAWNKVTQGTGWALATSTAGAGAPVEDQFAIQAIFISSAAAAGACSAAIPASAWDQAYAAPLTALPQTYTSTLFADPTLIGGVDGLPDKTGGGGANGRMKHDGRRGLCWRIVPPATVTSPDGQSITITVTAAPAVP